MRFFILTALICLVSGSSAPGRLRDFFSRIKSFATESGCDIDPEQSNQLIESAVKYAINEGRELDHFVSCLKIVCNNGIGKTDLDNLVWEAVDRLYRLPASIESFVPTADTREHQAPVEIVNDEPGIGTVSSSIKEGVVSPKEEGVFLRKEEQAVPRSSLIKKRKITETTSVIKDKLLSELELHFNSPICSRSATNTDGIRFLKQRHYQMAINGDFESLHNSLRIFSDAKTFSICSIFQLAFEVLKKDSFREDFDFRAEKRYKEFEGILATEATRESILARLEKYYSDGSEVRKVVGSVEDLSNRLLEMAKNKEWEKLQECLLVLEFGATIPHRIACVMERAYKFLNA